MLGKKIPVVVAALAAAVLLAIGGGLLVIRILGPERLTVGPAGGLVGPAGGPAQVEVPAGVVHRETSVAIAEVRPDPAWTADALAIPLAAGADITPSAPLPGAKVRLRLTGADLAIVAAHHATPAEVLMFVHEEGLGVWVPLPTTYEPASGQIVAVAPHFSGYRAGLWRKLEQAADLVDHGLDTFHGFVRDLAVATVKHVKESFSPERQTVDCPGQPKSWTVESSIAELDGCVDLPDDGSEVVKLQSGLAYPQSVIGPPGTDVTDDPFRADRPWYGQMVSNLGRSVGQGYLTPYGREQIKLPKGTTPLGGSTTVAVEPNQLAIFFTVFLGILDALPGAHTWRQIMESRVVRERLVTAVDADGVRATWQRITVIMREESSKTVDAKGLEQIDALNDLLDCVATTANEATKALHGGDGADLFGSALKAIQKCVRAQRTLSIAGLFEALEGIGNVVGAGRAVLDMARVGFGEAYAGKAQVTITHAVADPLADTDWPAVYPDRCPYESEGYGLRVQTVARGDFTGDEIADAVLVTYCDQRAGRALHTVTAFDGASDPDEPTRLGVLREGGDGPQQALGGPVAVKIDHNWVRVTGTADDENLLPAKMAQTFVWDGTALQRGPVRWLSAPPAASGGSPRRE